MNGIRQPFRVLVVDDSAYLRKVISRILQENPMLWVVGTARDGQDALAKVEELKPDVITLDLHMPEMNGLEFVRAQMKRRWVPIVIVSSEAVDGDLMMDALAAGAMDFVHKPTSLATERLYEMSRQLIDTVLGAGVAKQAAASVPLAAAIKRAARVPTLDALVIGASTGGPQALRYLIAGLPADFPAPIAVVLHMPIGYTQSFAQKLDEISALEVVEAESGVEMMVGRVIIAQAGHHLSLSRAVQGTVTAVLGMEPLDTLHRPAVDVLFKSASEAYGSRLMAVVLTGMGSDGADGAAWIKAAGGKVWTQSEDSCIVYGMPRSVAEAGLSDQILDLERMPAALCEVF